MPSPEDEGGGLATGSGVHGTAGSLTSPLTPSEQRLLGAFAATLAAEVADQQARRAEKSGTSQGETPRFRWSNDRPDERPRPLNAALRAFCEAVQGRLGEPSWLDRVLAAVLALDKHPGLSDQTLRRKLQDFRNGGAYLGPSQTSASQEPTGATQNSRTEGPDTSPTAQAPTAVPVIRAARTPRATAEDPAATPNAPPSVRHHTDIAPSVTLPPEESEGHGTTGTASPHPRGRTRKPGGGQTGRERRRQRVGDPPNADTGETTTSEAPHQDTASAPTALPSSCTPESAASATDRPVVPPRTPPLPTLRIGASDTARETAATINRNISGKLRQTLRHDGTGAPPTHTTSGDPPHAATSSDVSDPHMPPIPFLHPELAGDTTDAITTAHNGTDVSTRQEPTPRWNTASAPTTPPSSCTTPSAASRNDNAHTPQQEPHPGTPWPSTRHVWKKRRRGSDDSQDSATFGRVTLRTKRPTPSAVGQSCGQLCPHCSGQLLTRGVAKVDLQAGENGLQLADWVCHSCSNRFGAHIVRYQCAQLQCQKDSCLSCAREEMLLQK
jgi:hypothetical protein